ncbi:MAG TPA: energy transducer TonB [Longimicrobiales bacterium]
MVANYPARLRDRGIGGDVLVWLFIDAQGEVKRVLVKESAGHPDLDRGALTVAAHMKFSPATKDGQRVPVWVQMPITFRVTPRRW